MLLFDRCILFFILCIEQGHGFQRGRFGRCFWLPNSGPSPPLKIGVDISFHRSNLTYSIQSITVCTTSHSSKL